MKKEEGKAFDLNTKETTQKVLEVGTSTNETKIDDKTSFENFKVLYDGRIKEKCLADYGTIEDKELLEDTAKELYLTSQELIPDEDTKSEGDLEEEKTKQEENVKLTERAFKSGRTKTEAISNESKFLAHILNGVISDVQNKFNVTATGELDTGNKNKVVVTLKGSTLDLIDATSYLAKAIRRDDVDFTFDDEIKNNTVRCVISPKTKTESKDNEGSEYDYMLLSRLKSDCDYFLGNGNRYEKHLWAGNVDDQIAKMKELYNKLPEKPEWLTMEDIENYEKEMKQDKKMESKFDKSQAVLSLDNYHSMGIIVSDDGSTVQYMYSNDEDSVYESDIEYDEEGRPYFKDEEGETWYIDEFMKTTFSESKEVKKESEVFFPLDSKAQEKYKYKTVKDTNGTFFDIYKIGDSYYDVLGNEVTEEGKDMNTAMRESKSLDGEDVTNKFKNYKAFEGNFEPIRIVKNSYDKNYKVYRADETEANNFIYYTDSKDNLEGWLYGAVQAANGVFNKLSESKEVKEEARDRVAERLPKFVYDLTKADFDKYGETAWSANGPRKDANGRTIYEVYRNGKSDFTIAYVVAEIQKEFPQLKMTLQSTAPGDRVFFVKETKKQESQSTEVGYNEFTEDMEEIERTINFIKEPKNKDAKEVLDDIKEFLNKLWADKEQNTFGIKYAESKELTEEAEEPNTNKIDDIVAQLMEELPDFAQGYRDIIMELGLSKEDFIDMITTENEHQLLKDKNITEDEEKEVYGKIYDTLV